MAALSLLLFFWLAYATYNGATRSLDSVLRDLAHSLAAPLVTSLMRQVTAIGGYEFLIPLVIVSAAYLVKTERRRDAAFFATGAAAGELFEQVFKHSLRRARPEAFFGLESPATFSFPSGHALMSCIIYGMLAAAITTQLRDRMARGLVWAGAAGLIGAIGFSRVYLGMHWPTDVIGGYSLGVAWLVALRAFWRQ